MTRNKMEYVKQVILIFFILFFCSTVHAQSNKTLALCVSDSSTDALDAYFKLLQKAYSEIGYQTQLKKLPAKRANAYVNDGKMDGLVITTKSILGTFKNIIAVDIPLTHIDLVAYSITKNFEIQNLRSLKAYKIGILREYPLTVELTRNMDRQIVNNYNSLFSILQHGRVDLVFVIKKEAERFLAVNPQFKNVKALQPSIFVLPLYHFLNKKHETLAQEVAPIVNRLIKEKVLEELYNPYLK